MVLWVPKKPTAVFFSFRTTEKFTRKANLEVNGELLCPEFKQRRNLPIELAHLSATFKTWTKGMKSKRNGCNDINANMLQCPNLKTTSFSQLEFLGGFLNFIHFFIFLVFIPKTSVLSDFCLILFSLHVYKESCYACFTTIITFRASNRTLTDYSRTFIEMGIRKN